MPSPCVMLEARVTLASFHALQNMSRNEGRSVGEILDEMVILRTGGNALVPRPSYIPARVRPLLFRPVSCLQDLRDWATRKVKVLSTISSNVATLKLPWPSQSFLHPLRGFVRL